MKNNLVKKFVEIFFDKYFFCLKSTQSYAKKNHQNQSRKKIILGGLSPQAPDAFGLNLPSQLVIGYHWLAFPDHSLTVEDSRPNTLGIFSTKSTIFKKRKICSAFVLEHCESFGTKN